MEEANSTQSHLPAEQSEPRPEPANPAAEMVRESFLDALGPIGAPAWVLVVTLTLMRPGLLVLLSTVLTLLATVLYFVRGFVPYQRRILPYSWVGPLLLCLSSAGIGTLIFGPGPGASVLTALPMEPGVVGATAGATAGAAPYPFWLNSVLRAAWMAWFQAGIGCLLTVALLLSPSHPRLKQELEKGIHLPFKGWWVLPALMLLGSLMLTLFLRSLTA